VKCAHVEWPEDKVPETPFACYLLDYDKPICAGDEQIAVRHKWMVELYEKRRDRALEEALANELRACFGAVRRDENWIENDNLLQVVWTFYEIEGEFDG
jgi:hypothetical protein